MSETHDAGAEAGDEGFEQEFEAAREAQAPGDAEAAEQDAEGEQKPEGDKPPLSMEEIRKRLNDQQGATREERQRRRAAEQRAQELEARLSQQAKPAADGQALERPDPEEDPIGYLKYVEGLIATGEERQAQEKQQTEARQQAQRQVQAIVSAVEEHENDFRELTTDYDDAAEHLYAAKKAEYMEAGDSDAEAHTAVMQEFLTRSRRALETGKNPAEIVYNLAKRAGYTPKGGEAKLDAIERGQKRTSPLSRGGSGGNGELTMESVSKLSGAAFDSASPSVAKLQMSALGSGRYRTLAKPVRRLLARLPGVPTHFEKSKKPPQTTTLTVGGGGGSGGPSRQPHGRGRVRSPARPMNVCRTDAA
jgi:hypothetical protein